jgi:hypothetical protein
MPEAVRIAARFVVARYTSVHAVREMLRDLCAASAHALCNSSIWRPKQLM